MDRSWGTFGAEVDHFLLEQALRSEKQDLRNYVRILGAKRIPGALAEVLNDQMTQIGLGLSRLEYLDALKYESEQLARCRRGCR